MSVENESLIIWWHIYIFNFNCLYRNVSYLIYLYLFNDLDIMIPHTMNVWDFDFYELILEVELIFNSHHSISMVLYYVLNFNCLYSNVSNPIYFIMILYMMNDWDLDFYGLILVVENWFSILFFFVFGKTHITSLNINKFTYFT